MFICELSTVARDPKHNPDLFTPGVFRWLALKTSRTDFEFAQMLSQGLFYTQRYGSGIRCLLDHQIRNPGWVKNQDPDPG
jgi:hypothetical protein